jgi:23S rRNA (guanosine2251-2'-O)-methyltransferase
MYKPGTFKTKKSAHTTGGGKNFGTERGGARRKDDSAARSEPRRDDFKKDFKKRDDRPKRDGQRSDSARPSSAGFEKKYDRPKRDGQRDDRPKRDGQKPDWKKSDGQKRDFPRRDDRPKRDDRPQRDSERSNYKRPERNDRPKSDAPRQDRYRTERVRTERPQSEFAPKPVYISPERLVYGTHAVREAWMNSERKIKALYITEQTAKQVAEWGTPSVARPMPTVLEKTMFDRMLPNAVHQNVALDAQPLEESFITDLINAAEGKERTVLVMLDQVTDPHNVGAILRSTSAFGASGLIMQKLHAPELAGVLAKTACGAVEHVPVVYETNLTRTLESLQEQGFFVIGLDEHTEKAFADVKTPTKCVIVLGAEGTGLRRLVKERCDVLVRLPTGGAIASLNVSNAAAIALYAVSQ